MSKCATCGVDSAEETQIIADHYQKTFELNQDWWRERNKQFIFLLILTAVTILLTYRTPGVLAVIADVYNKLAGGSKDPVSIASGFPFDLLRSILLAATLYLMIQIYHRTIHISQMYKYLGGLESTLRSMLRLDRTSVTFTREGSFYDSRKESLLDLTGLVYALILGALLVLIAFGDKLINNASHNPKSIVDIILLVIIGVYYLSYFRTTLGGLKKWWRKLAKDHHYLLVGLAVLGAVFYSSGMLLFFHLIDNGWTAPRWAPLLIQLPVFVVSFVIAMSFVIGATRVSSTVSTPEADG